jgi:hypothetical protein
MIVVLRIDRHSPIGRQLTDRRMRNQRPVDMTSLLGRGIPGLLTEETRYLPVLLKETVGLEEVVQMGWAAALRAGAARHRLAVRLEAI